MEDLEGEEIQNVAFICLENATRQSIVHLCERCKDMNNLNNYHTYLNRKIGKMMVFGTNSLSASATIHHVHSLMMSCKL